MAAGVRPNVELAREAGLEIGPRGGIVVDAQMRTSAPDILAAGDAVETVHLLTGEPTLSMLAGPANRQGRIAADTICGRDSAYRGTQATAVVKVFEMTAGGTGLTEAELRQPASDYRKVYPHPNGHATYYPGTSPMFIKVLFEPADGKLLGAQVLGWDGVDKRIDVLAVALRAGMTRLRPRASGARLRPALRVGEGPGEHGGFPGLEPAARRHRSLVPGGLSGLRRAGDDSRRRTPAEYDAWHIPRRCCPVHGAAARLDEVPRDKPVYIYCRSGFRSYLAYCVLKQNGFDDVAFLSGGMMTYHGYHRTPLTVGRAACRW